MKISTGHILNAVPHANAALITQLVNTWWCAEEYGIVTPRQTAYFLGNAAVETAGFTRLDENLYYTTTAALRRTWPTRFKSDVVATPYLRNPRKLANLVYGGRMGSEDNGTADDDGYNYRGSGILQTTGKDNFAEVEKETGIECVANPELLRSFPAALQAACIFWKNRNLNKYAETYDISGLTKTIQGGTGGLDDRRLYIGRFIVALAPAGSTVLYNGSRGGDVIALQTWLQELGHYGGKLDGLFGDGTELAVRHFQAQAGLSPVDGIVGPNTMNALKIRIDSNVD